MIDLGYSNTWYKPNIWNGTEFVEQTSKIPPVVNKCRGLKHRTTEERLGPPNRGLDTVTTCKECGYCYHTDSSD